MRAATKMGIAKTGQRAQISTSVTARQAGFTIVEVLIVLAVTGILFVSAITIFSGKQGKTEFNQSINDIQNQLNQTINEVAAGNYPDPSSAKCEANPSTGIIDFGTAASTTQGASTGCIFLGKVVHFVKPTNGDNQQYYVYTLAGAQNHNGSITTSLVDAGPLVVPNNTDTNPLEFGLAVQDVRTGGTKIGSFAFVNSLSGSAESSGTNQVDLLPIKGDSLLSNSKDDEIVPIEKYFKPAPPGIPAGTADAVIPVNPAEGVTICFTSGTTNQSGQITIGSNGRALSTNLKIYNSQDCT
jgi:prepilin-type N-terminal cleavage/methylation domain-containing protein